VVIVSTTQEPISAVRIGLLLEDHIQPAVVEIAITLIHTSAVLGTRFQSEALILHAVKIRVTTQGHTSVVQESFQLKPHIQPAVIVKATIQALTSVVVESLV
jgi:hypothetical protein